MTWESVIYRDIWADDVRLRIDGTDVTYFRGALSQMGGYQLQEPYAFGPADFAFPQVTEFEVDKHGTGELSWVRHGANVELVPVVDGVYGERIWAGLVTTIGVTSDAALALHCDGAVSGRLALRLRPPPVFQSTKDIGLMCDTALAVCGVRMDPYMGPVTGLRRSNIGGGDLFLDWVNELLAGALTASGGQWTIGRLGRRYEMRHKDTTTVHATVFLKEVKLDVTRDLQEEPTTLYGTGTDPRGQKITNAVAPNLLRGEPADYPFADNRTFGLGTVNADTDTGQGIAVMISKLVGQGLMSRSEIGFDDEGAREYDEDAVDGVRALQRRAHLARTGDMNPATWRALFNVTVTGRSLAGAGILPMAELDETQQWLRTSNGSLDTSNPSYDPRRVQVDWTIDHGGGVWKRDMLRFSDRLLDRIHAEKNWVGSLALDGADLFAGDVDSDTVAPTPISRLDVREGWNIKVVGFDGDTLFHVSGINVGSDRNIRMAVDTRSRDLLTVGQIIARNKESRRSPAREFINSVRRPNAMGTTIVWSEIGGYLEADTPLEGGRWNKVEVVAGQAGTVERVRLRLRDDRAKFVCAILDKDVSPKRMAKVAGSNPLAYTPPPVPDDDPETPTPDPDPGSKWAKEHVQDRLRRQFLCLYSAGQGSQPLGYHPRRHRRDNGYVTDAPITGDWDEIAGFHFNTLGKGVLYLMIYPDRDCVLQAGQILFPNRAEGA